MVLLGTISRSMTVCLRQKKTAIIYMEQVHPPHLPLPHLTCWQSCWDHRAYWDQVAWWQVPCPPPAPPLKWCRAVIWKGWLWTYQGQDLREEAGWGVWSLSPRYSKPHVWVHTWTCRSTTHPPPPFTPPPPPIKFLVLPHLHLKTIHTEKMLSRTTIQCGPLGSAFGWPASLLCYTVALPSRGSRQ